MDSINKSSGKRDHKRHGTRAAIYVRRSTDKQEHSIETQVTMAERLAAERKLAIVHHYEDTESASKTPLNQRPGGKRMLADAQRDAFDVLIVYKRDRLFRGLAESTLGQAALADLGIEILYTNDAATQEGDIGQVIEFMYGWRSDMETKVLRDRILDNMKKRALKGELLPANAPLGYQWGGEAGSKYYELVPAEAEVVRKVFELYLKEGLEMKAIAVYLNTKTKDRPRSGKLWTDRRVSRVLKSSIYTGLVNMVVNQEAISCRSSKVPPIVSDKDFAAAQALAKTKNHENSDPFVDSTGDRTHRLWRVRQTAGRWERCKALHEEEWNGHDQAPPLLLLSSGEGRFGDVLPNGDRRPSHS